MKIPCKQKVTEKKPFKTRAKEWFKRNGISLALFCMMVGLMVASSISGAEAINVTKINEKSKVTGLDEFPKIAATVVQDVYKRQYYKRVQFLKIMMPLQFF